MILPSTTPATNAIQLPRVKGVRMPKLGVITPKVGRYKPAKVGGFSVPKVPGVPSA